VSLPTANERFYRDLVRYINSYHGIHPSVFTAPNGIRFEWIEHKVEYQILVDVSIIGPARMKDTLKGFALGLNEKYPELLL